MKILSRAPRVSITVESIVDRILIEFDPEDLSYIKSGVADFGLVGRAIRNDFGLWEFDHPLTQHWHMHPEARNIVDGIDCSEDHPDQVSADIIAALRSRL